MKLDNVPLMAEKEIHTAQTTDFRTEKNTVLPVIFRTQKYLYEIFTH